MLKILIDGLEFDFDGTISHRMLNPMFNSESSHTLNIKTVNTVRNKDNLEQLHLPEVGYNQVQYSSMIQTDAFIFVGAVYFTSVTDDYLDFHFNSVNDFWNTADVSLRSITIPWDAKYLPVKNSKMMAKFPISASYNGYMNAIDGTGAQLNNDTTAPVPFLRLNNVISSIFDNFKIDVRDNALTRHADMEQLYLFNCNSNAEYKFQGLGFYDAARFNVSIVDNKYVFTSAVEHGLVDQSYVLITAYLRPLAAQEQLNLKVLKVTVNDEFTISFDIVPVVPALTGYLNSVSIIKAHYGGHPTEQAKNHLPEINCGEFLHEVEKITGSCIFIDESSSTARIMFLKDILKSNDVIEISAFSGPVTDQAMVKQDGYKLSFDNPADDRWEARIKEITDILTIKDPVATRDNLPMTGNANNDLRFVQDENSYYRYFEISFLRSAGWEFYTENILPLQEAGGSFTISTKFSPVLTEAPAGFLTLSVEKEGNFMCVNEIKYEDFRLFFYRGDFLFLHLPGSHNLPLCTHDVYDFDGVKIPAANLALHWGGTYGLYNQLYKEWINLMVDRYREETRFVNWPGWMLNSFAWWKKYRINHMNYLIKSIDLEIKPTGIMLKNTVLVPV